MAKKDIPNLKEITKSLWDTMKQNKEGKMDNARALTQSYIASRILKGEADRIRAKRLTNLPDRLEFYE